MQNKKGFIIYGSYGYTGNLIAEHAIAKGLKPVLAGRNEQKLVEQARRLNLEYQVLDLVNTDRTIHTLTQFEAVVHCAGPFIHTYKSMAIACIKAGTHYLDITGEIPVIEGLAKLDEEATKAGIMLLPGAGFDVVPTDCVARYLKSILPDASRLSLAICSVSNSNSKSPSISRGTAKTMVEGLSGGTVLRDEGMIKLADPKTNIRTIAFANHKKRTCTRFSWGDIASAWYSTRIPHIEVFMAIPKQSIFMLKVANLLKPIFKYAFIKRFLKNRIDKRMPPGPTEKQRLNDSVIIQGEASNEDGKQVRCEITVPESYEFTARSVICIIEKVLKKNVKVGFQTPSTAYGENLVHEIEGASKWS